MKYCFFVLLAVFTCIHSRAQSYVFAQLSGTPVNTNGWTMTGLAAVTNVTGTGNTEVLLCPPQNFQSGAIFYNQPINLSVCNKWIAEFDFRIFDGTGADGIAFCFIDVPPAGFVNGGGLGIPATANGLKVCFDTYLNCSTTGSFVPKLELRWGNGYDECWTQPTISNATGVLSIIRSNDYCHAKITYNNGLIQVYLNNNLFLTGNQTFNFNGYLGFTASTGGSTDNHSIKNVVIYTDMPPSEAGANQTICSGQSVQLGTTPDPNYTYSWTPATNLSAANIANPTMSMTNNGSVPITTKYYVSTAFANNAGCSSLDSVMVTVAPGASVSITAASTAICSGGTAFFTAAVTNGGASPVLQWLVNGAVVSGSTGLSFNSNFLANGDVVSCIVNPGSSCPATSNPITITVNAPVTPSISISATATTICQGTTVSFATAVNNEGNAPLYQWKKNGNPVGINLPTYTDNTFQNGDIVTCTITSNASCVNPLTATSNAIVMTVTGSIVPAISITASANNVCATTQVSFTATSVNGGTAPTYQWQINGINTGNSSATFTPPSLNNNDLVQCVLSSSITCASPSTVTSNTIVMNLVPFATPTITVSTSLAGICTGDVASFTASYTNGGSNPFFQWKKNGTNVGTNSNIYIDNSVVTGDIISCVMTSNAACLTTLTATSNNLSVTIFANPQVVLDDNPTLCTGSTRQLNAGSFHSYLWNDGSTDKTKTINSLGTYWVTVTDIHGCKGSDTVIITTLLPPPSDFLPADSAVCAYDHFMLSANGNFSSYLWNNNTRSTQTQVKGPGLYWLQVTSSNNCTGRDTVVYTAKDCGNLIFYPTAFTPNNDGKNDTFKPLLLNQVEKYEFFIYNRWGQMIFSSKTPGKGWDGTFNGHTQNSQTFVWICTYQFSGEKQKTDKGTITLIR